MKLFTALVLARRSTAAQVVIALLCVAVAASVRLIFGSVLPLNVGWQPFSLVVLLAATTGGAVAGTTALVASSIAGNYLYTQPLYSLRVASPTEAVSVLMFTVVGAVIAYGGVRLRSFAQEAHSRAVALREAARNERELRDRLHAQAEHLRIVLDAAPLALWVARDPECRVVEGNRAAKELFGTAPAERVDRSPRRYFRNGVEIASDDLPMLRAARTRAPVMADELEVELADGRRVVVLTNAVPLFAEDGSVNGGIGSAVDVTDLRRAVEALEERDRRIAAQRDELRTILDVVPIGIGISYDDHATDIRANRQFAELLRIAPDQNASLTGPARDELPFRCERDGVEIPGHELPMQVAARTGKAVHGALLDVVFRDGTARKIVMNAAPFLSPDDGVRGSVAAVVDITRELATERALRESEECFRALVMASSDVVYRMNADWSRLRFFDGRRFSADAPDPTGTWVDKYVHQDDHARVYAAVETAIRTKKVFQIEHRVVGGGDRVGWTFSRAIPILDARGEVTEWFGAASDITAQKEAEQALRESEERFRIMADATPIALWVTNASGEVVFVNDEYRRFFGVTEAEVRGPGGWHPLIHPDDAARYVGGYGRALRERTVFRGEARVRHADGSWRWMTSYGAPRFAPSGEFLGHAGSSADITERRAAEDALREADRRKDEFLAMLAHELRNPLAPIRTSVEVLRMLGPEDDRLARAREMIERQVTHMTRLVDDLLDVSRITRGKIQLKLTVVSLAEVIEEAVEGARPWIAQHGHSLSVRLGPEPLLVSADRARLVQVVGNLLTNAAKFTPHAGHITVSAEATAGDEAVVRVRDTGIGIPKELQAGIFDLFRQEETSLARSQGGLGIGLTLVKRLVELHGGRVEVQSNGRGTGSEFAVTLPLAHARAPRLPFPDRSLPAATASVRVLVVEDNADAAESLKMLLELSGHEVRVARSGLQALRALDQFEPHVAFVDIGLPEMNGFEVARRLRADSRAAGAMLVALTGYGTDEDRAAAREAGFDRHLVKPVDGDAIVAIVASLAAGSRPSMSSAARQ